MRERWIRRAEPIVWSIAAAGVLLEAGALVAWALVAAPGG
jgi:hypothetical protein